MDIKGKTCCFESDSYSLADSWASQLLLFGKTLLCLMSPNECSLVATTTALLYTSQNLLHPSPLPRQQGLADLLLLLGETPITSNTFSTTPKPIMVK